MAMISSFEKSVNLAVFARDDPEKTADGWWYVWQVE